MCKKIDNKFSEKYPRNLSRIHKLRQAVVVMAQKMTMRYISKEV